MILECWPGFGCTGVVVFRFGRIPNSERCIPVRLPLSWQINLRDHHPVATLPSFCCIKHFKTYNAPHIEIIEVRSVVLRCKNTCKEHHKLRSPGNAGFAYALLGSSLSSLLLSVVLGFAPPEAAAEGASYSVSQEACSELRGLEDVEIDDGPTMDDASSPTILGCPVFTFYRAARTEVRLKLANTSETQRSAYCKLNTRLRSGQAREEAHRVVVPRKTHAVDVVWQISTGEASHGYIVCRLPEGVLLDAIHYRGREVPEGLTLPEGPGGGIHREAFDRLLGRRPHQGISAALGCLPMGVEKRVAVGQGFEPREPLGSTVFKTAAFDHSASPPTSPALGWRSAHYSPRHRGFKT